MLLSWIVISRPRASGKVIIMDDNRPRSLFSQLRDEVGGGLLLARCADSMAEEI